MLARVAKRGLSRALSQWEETTRSGMRLFMLARSAAARLVRAAEASAFARWLHEARAAAVRRQKQRYCLGRRVLLAARLVVSVARLIVSVARRECSETHRERSEA